MLLTLFQSTENVNGESNYRVITPIRSITSKTFEKVFYELLDAAANKTIWI